jgi:glycerophosphoryl diester phosphodiesterase
MNDIPRIIAHRGASATAPENSISALKRAWAEIADGVECDVRLTSDCQVVCIHDADTERVADRKLVVEAHTYEELAQLDVGAKKSESFRGESIPLLSDWMANVHAGKKVLIELKAGEEILNPLFDVIDASPVALKQIAVIVFDLEMVRALKARRPNLQVYWLIDVKSNWLGRSKLKLSDVLDTVVDTNVDGIGLRCHSGINREMVKAILEADIDLNIWTVDDPVDARRYASLGVSSITTNCPEVIRYALRS